jgi:hypothetical protein
LKTVKLLVGIIGMIGLISVIQGCAYGAMSTVGKEHVVILRNDALLFGALRQASVCKVTPSGLTGCKQAENP